MDEWWESEYGEHGEQCAENLLGYQPPEVIEGAGLYKILCVQCQLRHRCTVGAMVLRSALDEEMLVCALDAFKEREEAEHTAHALNGLEAP